MNSIIELVYSLEELVEPRKASILLINFIMECENDRNFNVLNQLLWEIELSRLSIHSISALTRFTFRLRNKLGNYPEFFKSVKIEFENRNVSDDILVGLK